MQKNQKSLSVKRGLYLLRIGWFFHNFMLVAPVIVLVYTGRGITVGDFFLIQGIFKVAAFLFEVPSGYLSDCFSRRRVMILGAMCAVLGLSIIASAYGFWAIVSGEALLGIASALYSGTIEAYTYDLLKRKRRQKHFLKEFGRIMAYGSIAAFVSSLAAGFMYLALGGAGLLWLQVLFTAMCVFAFVFLPELLEVKRNVKNKNAFADIIGITRKIHENKRIWTMILFPSVFGAFAVVLLWIMQPVMEVSNVPVALFGLYFGINQFSGILFAKYAYKIYDKIGAIYISAISIVSIIMASIMGLVAMSTSNMFIVYVACAIMAPVPSIRRLNNLQYNALIHRCVRSSERGTVLSARAMVTSLCGAVMLIVAKFLMDGYGIATTLVFLLVMSGLLFWILHKVRQVIK